MCKRVADASPELDNVLAAALGILENTTAACRVAELSKGKCRNCENQALAQGITVCAICRIGAHHVPHMRGEYLRGRDRRLSRTGKTDRRQGGGSHMLVSNALYSQHPCGWFQTIGAMLSNVVGRVKRTFSKGKQSLQPFQPCKWDGTSHTFEVCPSRYEIAFVKLRAYFCTCYLVTRAMLLVRFTYSAQRQETRVSRRHVYL